MSAALVFKMGDLGSILFQDRMQSLVRKNL